MLRITAFFGLFLPFAVQGGTALDASGRPAVNFLFTLATAILNIGLNYLFIPVYGLKGAAFATLSGYFLSFLAMQWYLYHHYRIVAFRAIGYMPVFYRK